jgi:hypothetical protein
MPNTTFGANPQFDAAVAAAESARQSAYASAALAYAGESGPQVSADTLARQRAAEIQYFRTLKAASIQFGVSSSAFISALVELTGSGQ